MEERQIETPKQAVVRMLANVPEAKRIYDAAAEEPLLDAAYRLLRQEFILNSILKESGLVTHEVLREVSRDLAFDRLKFVHPSASDEEIHDAMQKAKELRNASYRPQPVADNSGFNTAFRLAKECPGFQPETYRDAYYDYRLSNR